MFVTSYAHDNTFTVHATDTAIFIESHGKSVGITLMPEGARRMHRLLGEAIKQHDALVKSGEVSSTEASSTEAAKPEVASPETSSTEEVANA